MTTNFQGPMAPSPFPGGISTDFEYGPLGKYVAPDPTKWYTFWEDFTYFVGTLQAGTISADWTVTTTNTTLATVIGIDGSGGIASVTNTGADNDCAFLQWRGGLIAAAGVQETVLLVPDKKTIFKARWQVSDITQSDVFIGLMITTADPEAGVTDGAYFRKSDGGTNLQFVAEKDSSEITVDTNAATSLTFANSTWLTSSFVYNGAGRWDVFINDNRVGGINSTTASFCNDEDLAVTFGIKNGEAVAKTMLCDYIFVAQER